MSGAGWMTWLAAVAVSGSLGFASPAAAAPADPGIPAAIAQVYDGRDLKIRKDLGGTSAYTRHAVTYESGDLTITGIMNKPRGKGPFPVVVLAHGYIALHIDYRNHAGSDKDPTADTSMRLGYAADVINAGLAVRESTLPFIDNERLALLGRSMGGGVAFQALVIRPGVFDAAITYAATSSNTVDNFNKWQRYNNSLARTIIAKYGSPEAAPEVWRTMSARTYFARVTEPILMFHGTADESCDIAWARATDAALTGAGKDATLVEYKNAGHYFYGPWGDTIRRVDQFLGKHLGA